MNALLVGVSNDPWMRWTLLGLFRHRRRQLWVADVLRDRLGTDVRALSAGAHPRHIPDRGVVPGLDAWRYYFHGIGCELECVHTGERVDVDFRDAAGEDLDAGFYVKYLRSSRGPRRPESRVIALHPSCDTVSVTMEALVERGILLARNPTRPPIRLNPEVLADEAALRGVPEADDAHSRSARIEWLRTRVSQAGRGSDVLAYAELGPADLDAVLDEILAGPLSARTSGALAVIRTRNVAADEARVRTLLSRLDPSGPIPQRWLWERATEWLQRR